MKSMIFWVTASSLSTSSRSDSSRSSPFSKHWAMAFSSSSCKPLQNWPTTPSGPEALPPQAVRLSASTSASIREITFFIGCFLSPSLFSFS